MSCFIPQNRTEPDSSCKTTKIEQKIPFVIADPSGNITALVLLQSAPAASSLTGSKIMQNPTHAGFEASNLLSLIASKIMQNYPEVEQVGYVYTDDFGRYHLDMAGGEFCGNASISAACYLLAENRAKNSFCEKGIELYASGTKTPVWVQYDQVFTDACVCTVQMPVPKAIFTLNAPICSKIIPVSVVDFDGICHMILTDNIPDPDALALVRASAEKLSAKAVGLMQYNIKNHSLRPLVYVPGADTVFWEHSCASGTSAVGYYLAEMSGQEITQAIVQPGGTLTVRATPDGQIYLTNRCKLTKTVYEVSY